MTRRGLLQRVATQMSAWFTVAPAASTPTLPAIPRVLYLNLRTSTTMSAINNATTPLDTIFQQKRTLRVKVKRELKSMDSALRSKEDDAIQRIVLEAPWFKSCRRLCAYISCGVLREVDTLKLLSEILSTDQNDRIQVRKKLYVPRIEDKNSHMQMLHITRMDDMIANSMNILEPGPLDSEGKDREDVMFANEPVDLFLLPGLAFDKSGRRLGRGGGYYDAFLTKYQELAKDRQWKKPLFVALSYSLQILEDGIIPMASNDVPVDALVTSSGVIPISLAASDMCS